MSSTDVQTAGIGALLLPDLFGRYPSRDDLVEHVVDRGVALGDHADAPLVLQNEGGDDVGADVGLPRAGGTLDS